MLHPYVVDTNDDDDDELHLSCRKAAIPNDDDNDESYSIPHWADVSPGEAGKCRAKI